MSERLVRVCMLSANFWPVSPRRGTRHPLALAEMLIEEGYEVKVVAAFPQDPSGKVPSKYKGKLIDRELLRGIEIIRVPVLPLDRLGVARKLIFYISFIFSALLALPFVRNTGLIFCVEPDAPFLMIPGFLFSRFTGTRLVVLVTDLWPDVIFEFGLVKSRLAKKIVTLITLLAYKLADHIVTITPKLQAGIMKYGIPKDKISVIELAVDTSLFHPIPKTKVCNIETEIPNIESKFVVLYSGSFSPTYDFDTLLEAAKILEPNNDIIFIMRGHGESRSQMLRKISRLSLRNVLVLGPVPKIETVVNYINCADVCVVPIRSTGSSGFTHPSKVFEFWACGKPLIGCSDEELATLIKESQAGIAVKPRDPKLLADAIMFLYQDRETAIKMGMKGRVFVLNRFSYEAVKTKLTKIMKH